ncbi:MAG: pyruvoyl-dependent arginine decarboxylase [Patescibacteria group bacterium]
MNIYVVCGVGSGMTILSAFDSALKDAGCYNYNLIALSSIVPPGSKVSKVRRYKTPPEEYGHKLYVVKAEYRSEEVGKFIAAGIGWYQLEDGRGIFVEHEIKGETKIAVESEINLRIKNSLRDLATFRRIKFKESKIKSKIVLTQIKNHPTCVLVLAVYQSEGWE